MQSGLLLLARICLAAIFVKSGLDKLLDPAATMAQMAGKGVPLPGFTLIPTIAVELLGALSLILGYKTRIGAIALIGFLIPTTLIFHTNFAERMQVSQFLKNLSIIGGLLMVVGSEPGAYSLDARSAQSSRNRDR